MRFSTLHKAVSYLLVGTALVALAFSGELAPALLIGAGVSFVASWFIEPRESPGKLGPRLWVGATLLLLAYTLFDVVAGDAPTLVAAVHFLLFLVVNRLFNRRTSRDYLQLYVLSLVTLVAAAAFNTDISFAICFVLYIVAATWSMILLHLRREMEENYLFRHASPSTLTRRVEVQRILRSKRIVSGRFLLGTSLLSLTVFVASGVLFFLFPRVGFGLMFGKSRGGVSMAGFSDRIELGQFGRIRDNPAVVMRVELDDVPKTQLRLNWHWRGIAFDRYDGRTWRKDFSGFKQLPRGRRPRQFLTHRGARLEGARSARIYLEPISESSVLFTPGRALAIQLPNKRNYSRADPRYVRRDALGDLSVDGDPTQSRSYEVTYLPELTVTAEQQRATSVVPAKLARRYLQLPALPERVLNLARELTAGAATPYAKAEAVMRHLRTFRYTLDLKGSSKDEPLDEFLFELKEGHCEYFSTAMAVLLRAAGVPTRNVNGFLGGDYNPYGRYWVVRQGDAHSWVEVYLGERLGWVPFDPTPPDARLASREDGFLATVSAWFDSLRLKWFKYVIEYDLGKQVSLFKAIGEWVRGLFGGASGKGNLATNPLLWLALAVAVALAVWWRRRWRGGRGAKAARGAARRQHEVTRLYLGLLETLGGLGAVKRETETPLSFARRLAVEHHIAAELVARVTAVYNAVRFGGQPLAEAELRGLRALITELRKRKPAT